MNRPLHPLYGADPATLTRLMACYGPPDSAYAGTLAAAAASAAARLPNTGLEAAVDRWTTVPVEAPVFILGHWRSGTTHLFNLLSAGGSVAHATPVSVGLPWDFRLLGRAVAPVLRRAIPSERGIDGMAVTPSSPQEDEIALASMTVPSYYHGVYFPRHFSAAMTAGLFFDRCSDRDRSRWQSALRRFTGKVAAQGQGAEVLIKNPAHTSRVAVIREVWPNARFIHIVRDPHAVLQSTRRMFGRLLDMLALQRADPEVVDATILATYPRMMDALIADTADLPPERYAEVRFEDLEQQPLTEVHRVASQIGIGDIDAVMTGAERQLSRVAGYHKQTQEVPPEVARTVAERWLPQLAHWGYQRRDNGGAEGGSTC